MPAEEFAKGAGEAGHMVVSVSAAHSKISPSRGCVFCGYDGPCAQKDDMEHIRLEILEADTLVFVTPLYYYGMSAQLKILVDARRAYEFGKFYERMGGVLPCKNFYLFY